MGVISAVKNAVKRAIGSNPDTFDMTDKERRERQVEADYDRAKVEKAPVTERFKMLNNYYNLKPYTAEQALQIQEMLGLNFTPPVLPDPRIQVESQIDDSVPTFQFSGRDDDLDNKKAKIREQVVNYILYNNKIDELNLDNERNLNELGTAFWKVAFDGSITGPGFVGDIVIGNPDPANIFPDPNAYDIDECEYLIYPYRMHRRAARRKWGKIIDEIVNDGNRGDTEIYEGAQQTTPMDDETLQVVEYWYRDEEGDIACSIQVAGVEVKWIPKYWEVTRHSGNKMYPIIKYGKTPMRKSFWDQGEIEPNVPLFDAMNREFITSILNDAMTANDIILYEEGALADDQDGIANHPGAEVKVKQNKLGAVKRLGGVQSNGGLLNMIEFMHSKVEENNGNFESAQGKEPIRVTTSSGIAQLNERASARKDVKNAGRKQGFVRLAQLIDWTALEFYNTNRQILIRGEKPGEPNTVRTFNSAMVAGNQVVIVDGQQLPYFPTIDVEVTAGDGIKKSKAFTLAATQELSKINVTPANIGIVLAIVDLLDLPNKDEIRASMEAAVQMQMHPPMPAPGDPAGPQQGGETDIDQILEQVPPEMKEAFLKADPQHQQEILDDMFSMLKGGGPGGG